jgi:predicted esterase
MGVKFLRSSKSRRHRRLLASVVLLVVGLVALVVTACAGEETTSTTAAVTTTQAVTTTAAVITTQAVTTSVVATTTTTAGPEITITRDIRYIAQQREGWDPPLLDVYAPKQAGPWPLVVMLHGAGANKGYSYYPDWATKVAQRGAVVFVPDWGIVINKFGMFGPVTLTPKELRAALPVEIGDVAAIICFARATGPTYGGDPENLTLFGHSGGANQALMEPFSGAAASEGALAGAGSSIPESVVLFDADYLLAGTSMWDEVLAGEPSVMQLITPWPSLGRRVEFPITIIGSGDPGLSRELGDPWATDSWFVVRDPSGDIRRGLEKLGAFEGDRITNESIEQLLVERLKTDGDKVTYVRLSDSSHENLGPEGMESLLDALLPTPQE